MERYTPNARNGRHFEAYTGMKNTSWRIAEERKQSVLNYS
jgi:hypothetical protein